MHVVGEQRILVFCPRILTYGQYYNYALLRLAFYEVYSLAEDNVIGSIVFVIISISAYRGCVKRSKKTIFYSKTQH